MVPQSDLVIGVTYFSKVKFAITDPQKPCTKLCLLKTIFIVDSKSYIEHKMISKGIVMRHIIAFIAFISSCGFAYQAFSTHTMATILAFVASTIVFLTALANLSTNKKKGTSVNQSIGNNSKGIQIGGNVTINDKETKK